MKKAYYILLVIVLVSCDPTKYCGNSTASSVPGRMLILKGQTGKLNIQYGYKKIECHDYEKKEENIHLNLETSFVKSEIPFFFERDEFRIGDAYRYNYYESNYIKNEGETRIKLVMGFFIGIFLDYDSLSFDLPLNRSSKESCALFSYWEAHPNKCVNEEQENQIIELYKTLGYKGYVELAPNESHSFKKDDFFVEREGKEYEWHQWTRDSILKSWAEK